jgi:hypothetical protein
VTTLTRELKKSDSPIRRYLGWRFPNVRSLRPRYNLDTAGLSPSEPRPGARIAYQTLGTAFHWQVGLLVDPTPDLSLAFAGASHGGKEHISLFFKLRDEVGGSFTTGNRSRPRPPAPAVPAAGHRASALNPERLARVCWALALFTEVYRAGPFYRSPLGTLAPTASLEELLALPSDDEIADLLALTVTARQALLPALAARGAPLHVGRGFAGSADIAADADLIAGGLLLEVKVELGRPRPDGQRRCSLAQRTVHEVLGYLLLDYDDAYQLDTLGLYSARYAHLATWPVDEFLGVLAGGRVDLATARAEFREVVSTMPSPRRARRARRQQRQRRRPRDD